MDFYAFIAQDYDIHHSAENMCMIFFPLRQLNNSLGMAKINLFVWHGTSTQFMNYRTILKGVRVWKWPELRRKVQTEGRKTRNVNGTELSTNTNTQKKSATTEPFLHRSKFVVVSWRSLPQHLHFKIYFFQSQNLVMKMKTLCSR